MNKKTVWTIVFIATLIVGLALGYFTDVADDLPAICLSAFGLGGIIITTWKKSEKKGGVLVTSIVLMVISGFSAAFAEMSQDNVSKLIAAIVAVIALIAAILVPVVSKALSKNEKRTE